MRRLSIYLWLMLSFLVALAAAIILMPASGGLRPTTLSGALAASSGVAAFFVVAAFSPARREPGARTIWFLLALGVLAWFGYGVLTFYRVLRWGNLSFSPGYPDLLCGAGSALIIAALCLKVKRRPPRFSVQAVAGALAAAALALIVVVNFVIAPALRNPALTPWECFRDCCLAAADFALGALALVIIAIYGAHGMGRPWVQLAVGLIFYAVGDAIYWHLAEAGLYGPAGNLVTALFWTAAYLLIGLGAYYRRLVFKGVIRFPPVEGEGGAQSS